jgi:hypothetical protein
MTDPTAMGITDNARVAHENPAVLRSVRHTITPADTMRKYYGEIARNADAAFVLCGKVVDGKYRCCENETIPNCPFHQTWRTDKACALHVILMMVGQNPRALTQQEEDEINREAYRLDEANRPEDHR